jgi:hypothetical protein
MAPTRRLAAQGFLNENGRAFAAASIKSMLGAGRGRPSIINEYKRISINPLEYC